MGGCWTVCMKCTESDVVRSVLINGSMTEDFDVEAGVPQGSVLSPYLYSVYIDGLHKALRRRGLGMWIYGKLVPLLLYADDIALLAPSAAMLREMLTVVSDYQPLEIQPEPGQEQSCRSGFESAT
jgi:hypothetical protein